MGYIQMRPIVASYSEQKAFVNDMSHEIRTPLAIIRGNLDNVLASDAVTDDAAREDGPAEAAPASPAPARERGGGYGDSGAA